LTCFGHRRSGDIQRKPRSLSSTCSRQPCVTPRVLLNKTGKRRVQSILSQLVSGSTWLGSPLFLERIAGIQCGGGKERIARLYNICGCGVEPEVNVMSSARTTRLRLDNPERPCFGSRHPPGLDNSRSKHMSSFKCSSGEQHATPTLQAHHTLLKSEISSRVRAHPSFRVATPKSCIDSRVFWG
jgi:hypothetical protein